MTTLLFTLAAYLLGSVPFAVVSSKLFGLADPRSYGSGNPGATNVLRSGNKAAALVTLLGDGAKGWLAVWLARLYGADFGVGEMALALVIVAVFLGHVFPVFLGFKGGKGVATAAGVLLGIHPVFGLMSLATWLVVAFAFRYSSLAAIVTALEAGIMAWIFLNGAPIAPAVDVMCLLLVWRHQENIGRLMAGTESRIGKKK
ncbi:MAG: glycerol-3-phosphate 1-O-acyltransferase PlsY [Rhodocyclaceae bacterium]|nr:glycerol-3-phosphate 1-O-acyltransferase PlsY [Rhodocyclaceae bacterium]